jgi:acetyltransferase-like isoleucine patch superfamily enzyme
MFMSKLTLSQKISLAVSSCWGALLLFLPDEFSKFRVAFYNRKGCKIHSRVSISPNVRIKGRFEMGEGSSIAQNCSISGESAGVFIGKNVMIAPNVVIVAFDHGHQRADSPMVDQANVESPVIIEDDVWIAANVTIGKGVTIGRGTVIGANSFVRNSIPEFSIAGGVPAKVVRSRFENAR